MHAAEPPRIDLRAYAKVLWRRKWLLLAIVVAIPAVTYVVSKRTDKVYEASVLMQIQATRVDTSLFSVGYVPPPSPQSLSAASRRIRTTVVARAAAQLLNPPPSNPRKLLDQITVSSDKTRGTEEVSDLFTITAEAPTPSRAAAVANAFGAAVISTRKAEAVASLDVAINGLVSQLRDVPASDVDGRRQLSDELQRLRALRAAQGDNAIVVERAVEPLAPVSPQPVRAALIALVLSIFLGVGAVAVAESVDRRIRSPEDLLDLTDLPLLGSIPRSAYRLDSHTAVEDEAFQTLRASLSYLTIDRELKSILVTSPAKGDGKTLVSTRLASAFARAGKNVILVDADLRQPQVAARLGLPPAPGLAEVLVGGYDVHDCLTELETESTESGVIRVLRGGQPPNAAQLLASERMRELLTELSGMCDHVIVDTNPVLVVSDALPLLEQVSGVLLVARINTTRRDVLLRLANVIGSARGNALGIVATGTAARRGDGYYAGSYHTREKVPTKPENRSGISLRSLARAGRLRP